MSKTLSTHVLDATTGIPAAGIRVELRDRDGVTITSAETDSDGRIPELAPDGLVTGPYPLTFATG
ncbi:MAG: hydroxyisourate hydrolase, partial [Rhodococcus sp. (in: high G+C Gram-positive bacteria)]|nr:hydroxyisourate hydrolase [Rhodococcus sp. (in: high G+C Gram-positive bacteria)]